MTVPPTTRERTVASVTASRGRGIEHHVLIVGPGCVKQLLHALAAKELTRIQRDRTRGQDVQSILLERLRHVLEPGLLDQHGGEAGGALQVEMLGNRRPAQIRVDQQESLAGVRKHVGEVDRRARLLLAYQGGGHHEALHISDELYGLSVRARLPIGFGLDALRMLGRDHRDALGASVGRVRADDGPVEGRLSSQCPRVTGSGCRGSLG